MVENSVGVGGEGDTADRSRRYERRTADLFSGRGVPALDGARRRAGDESSVRRERNHDVRGSRRVERAHDLASLRVDDEHMPVFQTDASLSPPGENAIDRPSPGRSSGLAAVAIPVSLRQRARRPGAGTAVMVDRGDERLVAGERNRLHRVETEQAADEAGTRPGIPQLHRPVAGSDRELIAVG